MKDSIYRRSDSFFDEQSAVSPVIGVILMVAITVILAAVIGAFVLGIGGDLEQTPNSNLAISPDPDYEDNSTEAGISKNRMLMVDHKGGDAIQNDDIRVIIRNSDGDQLATFDDINDQTDVDADGVSNALELASAGADTQQVGDRVDIYIQDSVDLSSTDLSNGDKITVQIIHKPSDGVIADKTITLANN